MIPPSEREDILCSMFESFCITAIRNFGRNLKRAIKNRQKHDGTGEESVEYLVSLLSTEDVYAADQLVLDVDGLPCVLENELLYNALLTLPDKERRVILYDFWYEAVYHSKCNSTKIGKKDSPQRGPCDTVGVARQHCKEAADYGLPSSYQK